MPAFILAANIKSSGEPVYAQVRHGRVAWRAGFSVNGQEADGSGPYIDRAAAHRWPEALALLALVNAHNAHVPEKSWLHSLRLEVA